MTWMPGQEELGERLARAKPCMVYWGSHGCMYEQGHDGPHECECAFDEQGNREPKVDTDGVHNVGSPPYYGPETRFYGDDAQRLGLPD